MVNDDMLAVNPAIWKQGFAAGAQSPAQACPFPRHTREAWSWLLGWEKGMQQFLEHERYGEQATLVALSTLDVDTGRAIQGH